VKILQIQDNGWKCCSRPSHLRLDGCWWRIGGAGASPPAEVFATSDPQAYRRWGEEYAKFVEYHDIIGDVGRPGYFGRYAGALRRDWDVYCASDAAEPRLTAFASSKEQRPDWFDAFHVVPTDIALIARVIDGGYWDLFFPRRLDVRDGRAANARRIAHVRNLDSLRRRARVCQAT
jgi:hypothetical protein